MLVISELLRERDPPSVDASRCVVQSSARSVRMSGYIAAQPAGKLATLTSHESDIRLAPISSNGFVWAEHHADERKPEQPPEHVHAPEMISAVHVEHRPLALQRMNILPTFHLLRQKVRKRAKHFALHHLQTSQSAPQRAAHSATKAEIATPDDRLECIELSSALYYS